MWLEWLHILRDRTTRGLLVLVPAVQLVLFGYAVDTDPRGVRLAVAGGTPEQQQAALSVAETTARFTVRLGLPPGEAQAALTSGRTDVALELPPPSNAEDEAPPPRLIVDGADPGVVRPAVAALEVAFLRRVAARGSLSGIPPVLVEWRYNPELRTVWSVVPGLAGAIPMIGMLLLGALCVVRERERGSLELLRAAPLGPASILAGKLLPYLAIGGAQGLLILGLGHALFGLPWRGPPAPLVLALLLSAAAYLALGFAISCAARSQLQAMQGAVFLYLPSILLSGFLFPFAAMPDWAQVIGEALPLTHLTRIARDVLLRGGLPDGGMVELLALGLLASAALGVAAGAVARFLRR